MTVKDYHEQQFFDALNDIFIGAKIEGESGYINLMHIKSRYYREGVFPQLKKDIDEAVKDFPDFREELFDKLYSFFQRYFSESGSIYFRYTPLHQNIYEKVYTDERDVVLFWKTHMLYYVKTDRLFKSLAVEVDGVKFWFDASTLELKKANEKRAIIFSYREKRADGTLVFEVAYSERGRITKQEDILKALKKEGVELSDETLDKAFRVFEKQSEVDFFINKDARAFLREQFDLWMYQYLFEGENVWSERRLAQLQALKAIAYKVIDFISQFEDELVKIWNKPKFVNNSNYIITLDRIKDISLVENILKHENINEQIKEWQELGIVDENFKVTDVFENNKHLAKKYEHLPIDTKYFKDLELEILSKFDNLDKSLDGWLIKSENYQALKTILPKFKEKVQTIYIDPPFNTGNDFIFIDNFQDSSWLALMENRLGLAKELLSKQGSFYLHLDEISDYRGRELLNNLLNFEREIIWHSGGATPGFKIKSKTFLRAHDTILFYKNENAIFNKLFTINTNKTSEKIGWLDLIEIEPKKRYDIEIWENGKFISKKVFDDRKNLKMVEDVWKKIYSFNYSEARETESLSFASNQKPENLLRRIIQTSSNPEGLVLDYFVGSGTTCAVAQKLNRRWVGIEMGDHFNEIYLDIVKIKKQAEQEENGESEEEIIDEDNPAIVQVLSETKSEKTVLMKKIGTLGRMKIVLGGDKEFKAIHSPVIRKPHLTKDVNYQGGGFFKYYELEQYEDVLRLAHYEDSTLFHDPSQDPYHAYVFRPDLKLLESLEADAETNTVHFHPERLYPDPAKPSGTSIDLAETLSHLRGKWIKRITAEYVEFEDGEQMSLTDPDWQTLKPMIWWQ